MDVTRSALFSLLFVYSVSAFAAAEVEYISPEQHTKLENLFKDATFNPEKDAKTIQNHEWSCDMYGARSKMQVQHGLKLYKLSKEWQNSGAQLVSEYKSESTALIGRKDRFEDQVKITKDGQLVSRLSLNNANKTVLAYSVCKTL